MMNLDWDAPGESGNEGYLFELPHRSNLHIYTGFDLGVGDVTAIWLIQRVGGYPGVIDHFYKAARRFSLEA
jgi:hypothetical protein